MPVPPHQERSHAACISTRLVRVGRLVACAGVLAARHASRTLPSRAPAAAPRADATGVLRHLPLTFERNDGQFADRVRFAGVQSNGAIAIHDDGFTVAAASGGFFRAGDGYWYILQSRTRTARYVRLGTSGDIPIPSRR